MTEQELMNAFYRKHELAIEALNKIAVHGGLTKNGVIGTGKWASEIASAAIVNIKAVSVAALPQRDKVTDLKRKPE